ncbi:MAG: hypothetical protein QM753_15495 [Thermomicrobiales bacterium]
MADVDHHFEPEDRSSSQRSVVLLLDAAASGMNDLERYVSQLLSDTCPEGPRSGVIVSPVALGEWGERAEWRTIVVSDIARVAAAFGALTLPAVLMAGAIEETQQRLDAIVRRLGPSESGRVSGAISSSELR